MSRGLRHNCRSGKKSRGKSKEESAFRSNQLRWIRIKSAHWVQNNMRIIPVKQQEPRALTSTVRTADDYWNRRFGAQKK